MRFHVVHLEDDADMCARITKAVAHGWPEEPIRLTTIANPSELAAALEPDVDVVLADIGFPNDEGRDVNRIGDILDMVERISCTWSGDSDRGRPTVPVIVHTSRSDDLPMLMDIHRHRLYDIWHKSAATPEYVAWRLGRVARDLERVRPGRMLQKIASQLTVGPSWRTAVEMMLARYTSGWSELDQIERCGKPVGALADVIGCSDGKQLWSIVERWELIDRAADQRVRGHARHALHVFWLGYILLNHDSLASVWERAWQRLLQKRRDNDVVADVPWREALNNIWFVGAVFHDVGYALQDAPNVIATIGDVAKHYGAEWFTSAAVDCGKYDNALNTLFTALHDVGTENYKDLAARLSSHWTDTCARGKPDHGLSSAARLLVAETADASAKWWMLEAARVAGLHSAFPKVDVARLMDFEVDPLGALLLLLDQLQTWDRERPSRLAERDWPERAELAQLAVGPSTDGRVTVDLVIRYIVRRHVESNAVVFGAVEESLSDVLQTFPVAAIRKLAPKLPFDIRVKFMLAEKQVQTF